MNLKALVSAPFLLAIFALQSPARAQTAVDVKPSSGSIDRPAETARRVFEGSQFWWKHRSKVEDPTHELGFLSRLRRPLEAILHFFGRVLSQIFRFLRWLMPTTIPGLGAVTGASSGLLWGLGVIALAVISVIVYRVLRRRRLAADYPPTQRFEEPEPLPDALILMARARAALEAGNTFDALRLGFLAVLAGLVDRGVLQYDPARTNSEYARDLRSQPALAADFRQIALPFDRAFYGKIQPERVDVERTLAFCQSLMTAGAVST